MNSLVYAKSKKFSIRIVRLHSFLRKEKREFVMSNQLLKSGTSIGANLAEAECAISRADVLSKTYIALKETMETIYWLELLHETDLLSDGQFISLHKDAEELRKMLSSITKTIKNRET